jgi:hypothetical protein
MMGNFNQVWLSCLSWNDVLALKRRFNYFGFQSFDYEHTRNEVNALI